MIFEDLGQNHLLLDFIKTLKKGQLSRIIDKKNTPLKLWAAAKQQEEVVNSNPPFAVLK